MPGLLCFPPCLVSELSCWIAVYSCHCCFCLDNTKLQITTITVIVRLVLGCILLTWFSRLVGQMAGCIKMIVCNPHHPFLNRRGLQPVEFHPGCRVVYVTEPPWAHIPDIQPSNSSSSPLKKVMYCHW
jgi:hypothetical protein